MQQIIYKEQETRNKVLQEIRNVLKEYIRENCSNDKVSDSVCMQSDVKVLQQKEADNCLAAMMKHYI